MKHYQEASKLAFLVLLLPILACDSATSPEEVRELGIVSFHGDERGVIVVPESVSARESFTITVRTFGGGCTRAGDTEVEQSGNTVTASPFDITLQGPEVVCPAVLMRLDHEVSLHFDAPGQARILVRGRKVASDVPETIITLEKRVEVN